MSGKNVILDIDNTLLYTRTGIQTYEKLKLFTDPNNYKARRRCFAINVEGYEMWSVYRPHFEEFIEGLDMLFDNIIVWTAGEGSYAKTVVDQLWRDYKKPYLVLDREFCVVNKEQNGILEKPISRITKEIDSNINLTNTVIIDDRNFVFQYCNPDNGILIPSYSPDPTVQGILGDDDSFIRLLDFFSTPEFLKSKDIRKLSFDNIFKYEQPVYHQSSGKRGRINSN